MHHFTTQHGGGLGKSPHAHLTSQARNKEHRRHCKVHWSEEAGQAGLRSVEDRSETQRWLRFNGYA